VRPDRFAQMYADAALSEWRLVMLLEGDKVAGTGQRVFKLRDTTIDRIENSVSTRRNLSGVDRVLAVEGNDTGEYSYWKTAPSEARLINPDVSDYLLYHNAWWGDNQTKDPKGSRRRKQTERNPLKHRLAYIPRALAMPFHPTRVGRGFAYVVGGTKFPDQRKNPDSPVSEPVILSGLGWTKEPGWNPAKRFFGLWRSHRRNMIGGLLAAALGGNTDITNYVTWPFSVPYNTYTLASGQDPLADLITDLTPGGAGSDLTSEQLTAAQNLICTPGANQVYHNFPGSEAQKTAAFNLSWVSCGYDFGLKIDDSGLPDLTPEQKEEFNLKIQKYVCLPRANSAPGTQDDKAGTFNTCMANLGANSGRTKLTQGQIDNYNAKLYDACHAEAKAAYHNSAGSQEQKEGAFKDAWNACDVKRITLEGADISPHEAFGRFAFLPTGINASGHADEVAGDGEGSPVLTA
jgi:hypothetical protein